MGANCVTGIFDCWWYDGTWLNDYYLYPLPALGGDPDSVTLSGFSDGGTFATMMHVTNSDLFKGAGLIASRPFSIIDYAGLSGSFDNAAEAKYLSDESIKVA